MEVSFGAHFIEPRPIKRRVAGKAYETVNAAIVELDEKNAGDMFAINKVARNYSENNDNQNYALSVRNSFSRAYCDGKKPKNKHYFALTTQQDNFDELESDKILGVIQFINGLKANKETLLKIKPKADFQTRVEYFQVSPKTNFESSDREFKRAGRALLDSVKDFSPKEDIVLVADDNAIPFYMKEGFIVQTRGDNMIYYA